MDAQVLPPQDWRGNRFLQGIAPDLVERLATLLTRTEHAAGEFILREGEASDRICLLASGSVQVRKGDGAALTGCNITALWQRGSRSLRGSSRTDTRQ